MDTALPLALHPPDPAVRVRRARLSDVESLRQTCWPEHTPGRVYQILSRAQRHARQGNGAALVLLTGDDRAFGFGQVTLWPTCAEITDLIVQAGYRGQGLGTVLIQHLTQEARRLDVTTLEIGATVQNTGALALYRRLGFQDSHTLNVNLEHGIELVQYLRLML